MPTYCVTFRIAEQTVAGRTYQDRYNELLANLAAINRGYWSETTSFHLVGAQESIVSFTRRIMFGLSEYQDMLFVFSPEDRTACYFGHIEHESVLLSFFPSAKRID